MLAFVRDHKANQARVKNVIMRRFSDRKNINVIDRYISSDL